MAVTRRTGHVILIRHAEPAQAGSDPGLSPAGVARAAELIHLLGDAGIAKIVTSHLNRTQQTAAALAAHLGQVPVVLPAADIAAIVDEILPGGLVLVVGHTDTLPDVIDQLGAGPIPVIAHDEFDHMYVVQRSHLVHLRTSVP